MGKEEESGLTMLDYFLKSENLIIIPHITHFRQGRIEGGI